MRTMTETERFLNFMQQYESRQVPEREYLALTGSMSRSFVPGLSRAEVRSHDRAFRSYVREILPGGCVLYRLVRSVAGSRTSSGCNGGAA